MNEPLFVFIALSGSVILGYIFSSSLMRWRVENLVTEKSNLENSLLENSSIISRLQTECETSKMAVDNLQRLSQNIENQEIEKDKELKALRLENARLQEEIQFLTENPIEKIKEIDVIREVPVLVIREISLPESRSEKAKKLMKAFTKGYLDENEILQTVAKSDVLDE